jgi:hypothetical protein
MFYTVQGMKPFQPPISPLASASYAACRFGGVPPEIARVELALPVETAAELERLFLTRRAGGPGFMRPRFARHLAHVEAVMAEGGYPALAARGGR